MMRLSKRSYGAFTFACLAIPATWLSVQGCARDGAPKSEPLGRNQAAIVGDQQRLVPWGHGLSFLPGGKEARGSGPEAIAFAPDGDGFYVLDSVAKRVVHVGDGGAVHLVADQLPADANGIAVSPTGQVAVHRAVTLSVSVYNTRGDLAGEVPVPPGARDADIVHFLAGNRVMLEHPYQERYLLGSVAAPRQAEVVVPSRREGVAAGFEEVGYVIQVRHPDGAEPEVDPAIARLGRGPARAGSHAYLVERAPDGEPANGSLRYRSRTLMDLGEATAATIVGVVGKSLCAVAEHVDLEATVVQVKREVLCASVDAKSVGVRFPVETSELYTPRTEFVFDGKRVGQAIPTADGLMLRTVSVGEVSK